MTYGWEQLMHLIKLAEKAKRYDDMAQAVKKVVELMDGKLNAQERTFVFVAYRKIVDEHRFSIRVIKSIERQRWRKLSERQQQMVKELLESVKCDMNEKSQEVLELLDKYLLPNAGDHQVKVYYLKIKADFCRYLAEMTSDPDVVLKSHMAYKEAFDLAKNKLRPSDPVRLAVALNFSIFLHDIINLTDQALKMSRQAHDDASDDLSADTSGDSFRRESISILEKLEENQTLWNEKGFVARIWQKLID